MKKLGLLAASIAVMGVLSFMPADAKAPVQTNATAPEIQAKANTYRVAIIDVPQVVAASGQVKALKKEREAQAKTLIALIEKARKDVANITDADKKKAAEDKYTKEIQDKQLKMNNDYEKKLKAIDVAISKQIETQAKAKGYNIVLSKATVLFGGDDITAEIIKDVK